MTFILKKKKQYKVKRPLMNEMDRQVPLMDEIDDKVIHHFFLLSSVLYPS